MKEEAVYGVHSQYQALLREGRFKIQRCNECSMHVFYPRQCCPHCANSSLEWIEPLGTGTVYSTTTVRIGSDGPRNVALIDLDEGVRMMGRVEGIAPENVTIGLRVNAVVRNEESGAIVIFNALRG